MTCHYKQYLDQFRQGWQVKNREGKKKQLKTINILKYLVRTCKYLLYTYILSYMQIQLFMCNIYVHACTNTHTHAHISFLFLFHAVLHIGPALDTFSSISSVL